MSAAPARRELDRARLPRGVPPPKRDSMPSGRGRHGRECGPRAPASGRAPPWPGHVRPVPSPAGGREGVESPAGACRPPPWRARSGWWSARGFPLLGVFRAPSRGFRPRARARARRCGPLPGWEPWPGPPPPAPGAGARPAGGDARGARRRRPTAPGRRGGSRPGVAGSKASRPFTSTGWRKTVRGVRRSFFRTSRVCTSLGTGPA